MVGVLVGRVVAWLADSCVGTGLPGLVLQNTSIHHGWYWIYLNNMVKPKHLRGEWAAWHLHGDWAAWAGAPSICMRTGLPNVILSKNIVTLSKNIVTLSKNIVTL